MIKIDRFIPNESDNMHCLQSCYIMTVESLTGQSLTMKEAEQDTRFIKGRATWPFACLLSFVKKDLKVVNVSNENLELFVENPFAMIYEITQDSELTKEIMNITDIPVEKEIVNQILKSRNIEINKRIPSIQEMQKFIDDDYIIICNVNSKKLAGKDGYTGHFVIVEYYDDNHLYLKNPGLPAIENQKITKEIFTKAWHDPRKEMANFIAISKGK